jgi:integrase
MPDYQLVFYRGAYATYWRENGKAQRRSTGSQDASEAALIHTEFIRQAALDIAPTLLFKDYWQKYRDHLDGRPAHRTMGAESKAVLPFFGEMQAIQINEDACSRYIALRRKMGRKDGTILTELNRVSSTLHHAKKHLLIDAIPVMKFPPRPDSKDHYLTKEQVQALIDHAFMPHIKVFIALAVTTGARLSAILQLTWDRIDFERGLIHLRVKGQVGKGRAIVPMNETARVVLTEAKSRTNSDVVVAWGGLPIKSVKTGLNLSAKKAKIPGVGAHIFRHSAAVWMAEADISMSVIAQYLGHSNTAVTERVYARYSPNFLRNAAAALEL